MFGAVTVGWNDRGLEEKSIMGGRRMMGGGAEGKKGAGKRKGVLCGSHVTHVGNGWWFASTCF